MNVKKNWLLWLGVIGCAVFLGAIIEMLNWHRNSSVNNSYISELTYEENSKIPTPYAVSVRAPIKSNFQKGKTNSYEFEVTNIGQTADTYNLSLEVSTYDIDKNLILPVQINMSNLPETVFLKPGKSKSIKGEIEIPMETVNNFMITIKAESQSVKNLLDAGETDVFIE